MENISVIQILYSSIQIIYTSNLPNNLGARYTVDDVYGICVAVHMPTIFPFNTINSSNMKTH